jgi:hypothetical protein
LQMISNRGKRTNSLGFAQSDCHTCTSLGEKCDRRRPRCTTCLDRGRRCGGFATSLSWDNSRRMIYSPSSTSAAQQYSPKQFRFVNGATRPRKRRKEHGGQSTEPEELSAVTTEPLLRATGQELEISDEYQWDNSFADLGKPHRPFIKIAIHALYRRTARAILV